MTENFHSRDLVFLLCILMGGETKAKLEAPQELNGFAEDVMSMVFIQITFLSLWHTRPTFPLDGN
jgi:hypothetical protein